MDRIGPNARVVLDYTLKADGGSSTQGRSFGLGAQAIVYIHGAAG